jgi:hypothetical protein
MNNTGCYETASSSYKTNGNYTPIVAPVPTGVIPEMFLHTKPHKFIQRTQHQPVQMNCSGYKMLDQIPYKNHYKNPY